MAEEPKPPKSDEDSDDDIDEKGADSDGDSVKGMKIHVDTPAVTLEDDMIDDYIEL